MKLTHTILKFELQIDTQFTVPGIDSVLGGHISRGSIKEGDKLHLGPMENGLFREVTVKTVHRNRVPCRLIQAGQAATVALTENHRDILRRVCTLCLCLDQHECVFNQLQLK